MAALSAVYPLVQLDCPGVPHPVLADAVLRAAREFCKQTHAITASIPITTIAGTQDYAPTMAVGTELLVLLSLKRAANELLDIETQDDIDAREAESGEASVCAVIETYPLSIRLHPTPDAIETLTANLAVMPTKAATTIDDRLADWYLEGVAAYARYWLMSQPSKPWTNLEAAAFANRQYVAQTADARVRRNQARANLPLNVQIQMSPFA